MALQHWLQLALTRGIGPILIRRIVDAAGGAEQACAASVGLLRNIEGIGTAKAETLVRAMRESSAETQPEIERAAAIGCRIVCFDDPDYPLLLRSIPDPPPVLYVKGTLEARDLHAVAVVGSRKCSYYGREQSERFAALLAGAGVCVVSGGARGIDSAAHRGAMSHPHGRTLAVLGSGVDVPYPPENASLFEQIARRGAVISEYPLGTPPLKDNFPRRNRIISGMSRGVLVIEADERSGALITARQAADDHNRPVFAVPGRVDNVLSAGPHKLIRDGAAIAGRLEDILDNLGPLPQEATEQIGLAECVSGDGTPAAAAAMLFVDSAKSIRPEAATLTDQQQTILQAISSDHVSVDTIIERTSLSAQAVLQELTLLSLRGTVRRVDGQTYARRV